MKSLLLFLILFKTVILLRISKGPLTDKTGLDELSNADLEKMIKDYGLDKKDLGILSTGVKNGKKFNDPIKTGKKGEDLLADVGEDAIKTILGKDDATKMTVDINQICRNNKEIINNFNINIKDLFNLISFISKFQIFNKLPVSAQNIISEAQSKDSYKVMKKQFMNKTEEMNILISNTLNSQVFMDHQNKVGRKGMLTILIKNSAEIKNVWAVLNDKVFCFYKTSNYLNIIRIYRVSMIKLRDFLYSPCFFIYYDHNTEVNTMNFADTQFLICALNFREKDYWLKTLEYYISQYANDKKTKIE